MGRRTIGHPVYVATYILFVLFAVLPVVYTLGAALFTDGSLQENLQQLDRETFLLLGKSALLAFFTGLFSTIIGTFLGFSLYKTKTRFRGFFKVVLLVPLFVSPYILAVAWKDFFFLVSGNTGFIMSYAGVVMVLTTIYAPLSMLITGSALSNINAGMEEAGALITNQRRVVWHITLPLIKPALISSFVLVFIFSISEFSVPAFFGIRVFTTEIFTQFSAFYNHSLAMLQSVLLILVCVFLLLTEGRYLADAPFLSIGGRGTRSKLYSHGSIAGLAVSSGWLLLTVGMPFLVLFIQSFSGGWESFIRAFRLLEPTFGDSFLLAAAGAFLIVFVGFAAAYRSSRSSSSSRHHSFDGLLLFLFAIPSIIYGISLIKFFNRPALEWVYAGYAIILIGYVGKFSFIASRLIGNAMKQIPASLDEAAQIEGVSVFSRLWKIEIPLILPALFAAFIIGFIFSLGELGTTIMVYPPGTEIMPIKVFTIMANAPQSLTSSMTLIVFSVTLLVITVFYFMMKPLTKKYKIADDRS